MFDGFKIQDLWVRTAAQLLHNRLIFAASIDQQSGAILDPLRRATDRGLTFTLIPRLTGGEHRIELKGSIHRFFNEILQQAALGNADDFTVDNLLTALDHLVTIYGIDLFNSILNNIEFGVNVRLPFPAAHVLKNLVSYKNRPFVLDTRSPTPYYQCQTQRYIVKLYDKGHQNRLDAHLLRVELKVLKMEYLHNHKTHNLPLRTLADLLNVTNYQPLGALLVDTFREILFDDPTINAKGLTPRERSLYQNGRNPRYWIRPDNLTPKQTDAYRQRLHRTERKYRTLLDRYGRGNWQAQTAVLIAQKWSQLSTVDHQLMSRISERRAAWNSCMIATWKGDNSSENTAMIEGNSRNITEINQPEKCHKLTGGQKANSSEIAVKNTPETSLESDHEMSRINPLYLPLKRDINRGPINTQSEAVFCPITGIPITTTSTTMRGVRRFVSAAMLRSNDDLLMRLNNQFGQYAKGSKEDDCSRVAHNIRNADSNPRNNLRRSINKINRQPTLFDITDTLRLTADQGATLNYWQGTPYEVRL